MAACGSGGELVWRTVFRGLASASTSTSPKRACRRPARYRLEFGQQRTFRGEIQRHDALTCCRGRVAPSTATSQMLDVVPQFDGNNDRLDASHWRTLRRRATTCATTERLSSDVWNVRTRGYDGPAPADRRADRCPVKIYRPSKAEASAADVDTSGFKSCRGTSAVALVPRRQWI